jgi:hypothetical protein
MAKPKAPHPTGGSALSAPRTVAVQALMDEIEMLKATLRMVFALRRSRGVTRATRHKTDGGCALAIFNHTREIRRLKAKITSIVS